jgi:hypothetical protein
VFRASPKRASEQPSHVEGVFVGDELFLRDPLTGKVFSSHRDTQGDLVPVGRWLVESKSIAFEAAPRPPKVRSGLCSQPQQRDSARMSRSGGGSAAA